jgi:hypothetical protein
MHLNPIELVWSTAKEYVAIKNTAIKLVKDINTTRSSEKN